MSFFTQNTPSSYSQRRSRRQRKGRAMSEINVTPFVDVMLVLLIVFMVSAPLLSVGIPIQLPKTAADALEIEQEKPLTISISANGDVALQDIPIASDELVSRLQLIVHERISKKVFIRSDEGVSYGRVAEIMGALNAAGVYEIGLVTDGGGPTLDGPVN